MKLIIIILCYSLVVYATDIIPNEINGDSSEGQPKIIMVKGNHTLAINVNKNKKRIHSKKKKYHRYQHTKLK